MLVTTKFRYFRVSLPLSEGKTFKFGIVFSLFSLCSLPAVCALCSSFSVSYTRVFSFAVFVFNFGVFALPLISFLFLAFI